MNVNPQRDARYSVFMHCGLDCAPYEIHVLTIFNCFQIPLRQDVRCINYEASRTAKTMIVVKQRVL